MKEIGGYIEFEYFNGKMLHEDGIKLNCGRNALEYLIQANGIKKILMPCFMCDSCDDVLEKNDVRVRLYHIDIDFKPVLDYLEDEEWLYVVNFYGQLSKEYLYYLKEKYPRMIVDNAQAYFDEPVPGIPSIYTCRKFFGVTDGAILYSNKTIEVCEQDESFKRMQFLLGRFERSASEFYMDYVNNNNMFKRAGIKRMSKLTENLLHGINYDEIRKIRTENFRYLHKELSGMNKLSLVIPEGPFMYPFFVEKGNELRKALQEDKIFIPTLWPAVFNRCNENELEYSMAQNILPLPVDQRYGINEMAYVVEMINKLLGAITS